MPVKSSPTAATLRGLGLFLTLFTVATWLRSRLMAYALERRPELRAVRSLFD